MRADGPICVKDIRGGQTLRDHSRSRRRGDGGRGCAGARGALFCFWKDFRLDARGRVAISRGRSWHPSVAMLRRTNIAVSWSAFRPFPDVLSFSGLVFPARLWATAFCLRVAPVGRPVTAFSTSVFTFLGAVPGFWRAVGTGRGAVLGFSGGCTHRFRACTHLLETCTRSTGPMRVSTGAYPVRTGSKKATTGSYPVQTGWKSWKKAGKVVFPVQTARWAGFYRLGPGLNWRSTQTNRKEQQVWNTGK